MDMMNKILSWLVTIGLCIVLIPIGCMLLLINVIWSMVDKLVGIIKHGGLNEE